MMVRSRRRIRATQNLTLLLNTFALYHAQILSVSDHDRRTPMMEILQVNTDPTTRDSAKPFTIQDERAHPR